MLRMSHPYQPDILRLIGCLLLIATPSIGSIPAGIYPARFMRAMAVPPTRRLLVTTGVMVAAMGVLVLFQEPVVEARQRNC